MIRSSGGSGSARDDRLAGRTSGTAGGAAGPGGTSSAGRTHRAGSDVRHDQQAPFLAALARARATAYPAGEYVGQESFMRASEIRSLAHQARIGPGVSLLDLCCGLAGPGRMITAESGC